MKNNKGFTLIELLVAMAIIALLIALTIFGVSAALRGSRNTSRQNLAKEMQTAIAIYQGKYRGFPDTIVATDKGNGETTVSIQNTSGSKVVDFDYNMVVVDTSGNSNPDFGTDEAYFCYDSTLGGSADNYALGVKLEDADWYYMTTTPCF